MPFLPRYDGNYRLFTDRSLPVSRRSLACSGPRALGTAHGQTFGIDKTHLDQHRGLVPVDVLVGYLPIPKLDYDHHRDLDPFPGRGNAWQQPVHLDGVGEPVDQLVYYSVIADGARDRDDLGIRRLLGDEALGVKLAHLLQSHASGEHRDVIYLRIIYHGFERILDVLRLEL